MMKLMHFTVSFSKAAYYFRIINLVEISAFLSALLNICIEAIGGGLHILKAAKLAF